MAIDPISETQQTPVLGAPAQTTPATPALPNLPPVGTTPAFQFDPSKYLPGIEQQASAIYNPQQAQLEALQQLQASKTEQARIRTTEDFAKELERRKEAINQRGAFFGGGAINQEGDVLKRQSYALTDLNLQAQADQAALQAQRAGLSAQQADYIKNQLMTAQGGAYSQFQDQRTFEASQMQNDRQFQLDLAQFGQQQAEFNYQKEVDTRNFDQQKLQYEQQYALDLEKFGQEKANDLFNQNMATAEFEYEKIQDDKEFNFRQQEADRNYQLDVDRFGFAKAQQVYQEQIDKARMQQDQKQFDRNYKLQLKQLEFDKKKSKEQKAEEKARLEEEKRQFDASLAQKYASTREA